MKVMVSCLGACFLAVAAQAAASSPASGPTVATPPNTTVTAPKAKKQKKVCRERQRSGSHLTNITCKTPEQWAQLQEDLDTEAELGIPGNKTSSGRSINRGTLPVDGGPVRGGAGPN